MKAQWLYWIAALAGLAMPFLMLPDSGSRGLLLFGAASLSALSAVLGFARGLGEKSGWSDMLVGVVWLVAGTVCSLPLLPSMPSLMGETQAFAAGTGALALAAISLRLGWTRSPLPFRVLRVAGVGIAAGMLARAGIREYAAMQDTTSEGLAAVATEAQAFGAIVLVGVAMLLVGVVGERVSARPA